MIGMLGPAVGWRRNRSDRPLPKSRGEGGKDSNLRYDCSYTRQRRVALDHSATPSNRRPYGSGLATRKSMTASNRADRRRCSPELERLEPISKSLEEDYQASELDKAEEV